jgi:hypothetical protein
MDPKVGVWNSRDPKVRAVVAHEALILGPWEYGKAICALVGSRRPFRSSPKSRHTAFPKSMFTTRQSLRTKWPAPVASRYRSANEATGASSLYNSRYLSASPR